MKTWKPEILCGPFLQQFAEWLNRWGNIDERVKVFNSVDYTRGYKDAINDVYRELGLDWK